MIHVRANVKCFNDEIKTSEQAVVTKVESLGDPFPNVFALTLQHVD
jgi:hypothetical protein